MPLKVEILIINYYGSSDNSMCFYPLSSSGEGWGEVIYKLIAEWSFEYY